MSVSEIISVTTSSKPPSVTEINNYETRSNRSEIFSGIEINQNAMPASGTDFIPTDEGWAFQTFKLPHNYQREEKYAPDITGFQACVNAYENQYIPSFQYIFQYESANQWITLASGVVNGIHAFGQEIWADIYFSENIEVNPEQLKSNYRIGLTTTNISGWWFSRKPAYSEGQGYNLSGESLIDNGSYMYRLLSYSADSGTDWLGNPYRSVVFNNQAKDITTYYADNPNAYWFSKPNPDKFAVENLYFDISENGQPQVINGLLINPITQGPIFHIYYSNDGESVTTPEEWDHKLWSPVSQTYRLSRKETCILPAPITAKYICLEFSRLQAQYYAPGLYQQPITYKKFPEWIYQYFNNAPKLTLDPFTANQVRVIFNKLKLGFDYYLEDLNPEPEIPQIEEKTPEPEEVRIDPAVLTNINTNLAPYTAPLSANVTGQTVMSNYVRSALRSYELPIEELKVATQANTYYVSVPEREKIIEEENLPDLYFFINSRHYYQINQAELEYNRAYFVGIKELAFLREDYAVKRDTPLYIETAGDNQNTLVNDFYSINETWRVINEP